MVRDDTDNIPVITIDGTSGTGKGTLMRMLAKHLQWHMLDSGSIYRVLAYAVLQQQVDPRDPQAVVALAGHLPIEFEENNEGEMIIRYADEDITAAIRAVAISRMASEVSSIPEVRSALLQRQRDFRAKPGLVTDGRDMGTVVFPNAQLKIYLDANIEERAKRRAKQLNKAGNSVSLAQILSELKSRDERDMKRDAAPLKAAADAKIIDTSHLSIHSVFERVLKLAKQRFDLA